MTIQLIEIGEDDSFLTVANYVADVLNEGQAKTALAETPGSKFLEECTGLLGEQRFDEFVAKVIPHLDLVFSKCADSKAAECVANILVHAVTRVDAAKQLASVQALTAAFASKVDERSEERLGAMLNLYGATDAAASQFAVLLAAADYARKGLRLAALLVPAVRGKSDDMIRAWQLSQQQTRELLIALATLLKVGSDRASVKEYWRLVTSALERGQEGDAAALAQLRPLALSAVVDFIRSPAIFHADFAPFAPVRQLANDKATAPLLELFDAVLSGDLKAFKAAAQPALLEQVGVSADAALSKARMVALLALGSKSTHEEVSFADIQRALDISEELVEPWLVRAIGAKLLEGKIDQVRNVAVITRCTQRTFASPEWKAVRAQLAAWKDSLSHVSSTIQSQQASTVARGVQAIKV